MPKKSIKKSGIVSPELVAWYHRYRHMGGLNTTQSGNTITIKTWNGLGGSFGKTGFGTVTFGTLAGGAGAKLTGGNFWQGAATGLAVSWFNHHLHKKEIKSIARGILESKNINPDGKAMEHYDNVNYSKSRKNITNNT